MDEWDYIPPDQNIKIGDTVQVVKGKCYLTTTGIVRGFFRTYYNDKVVYIDNGLEMCVANADNVKIINSMRVGDEVKILVGFGKGRKAKIVDINKKSNYKYLCEISGFAEELWYRESEVSPIMKTLNESLPRANKLIDENFFELF